MNIILPSWKQVAKHSLLIGFLALFLGANTSFAVSYPPEVQNIQVQNNPDGTITLSWDEAVDPEDLVISYRIYQGVKSVKTADDSYDTDFETRARDTSYTVKNLEEGVRYYFAITALNSSGLESTTYSKEISAIARTEAPEVVEEEPEIIEEEPEETPVIVDTPVEDESPTNQTETNEPDIDNNSVEASTIEEPINDKTAPMEATNIFVDTSMAERSQKVIVNWTKSLNLDNDVSDQILYTRAGLGGWDEGYSVGPDIETIEIGVEPNQNYQIRLTTVDESGNESIGVIYSFSTHLNESGPSNFLAPAIATALFLMLLVFGIRRRQT